MSEDRLPLESLKDAVKCIGSQSATARLLGVTQAAVWGWLNRGTQLPAEHVLPIEAATGVSKHRLRPDVYGPEPVGDTSALATFPANLEPTR